MKVIAIGIGLIGAFCGCFSSLSTQKVTTIVITGDLKGHLEPCGCTLPTTGGIQRQAGLLRKWKAEGNLVILANGSMVSGNSRQDEIKAETISQAYGAMGVTAINLAVEDSRLGIGNLNSIQNITQGKLISGSVDGVAVINPTVTSSQAVIGAVSTRPEQVALPIGGHAVSLKAAITSLLSESRQADLPAILMLDGTELEAKSLAQQFPHLGLIIYRSSSSLPTAARMVGQTMLVTPGERGKSIVKINLNGSKFEDYQVIPLGPEVANDPTVSRFYGEYLKRVGREGLLDRIARSPSTPFAGSKACSSCHVSAYAKWHSSKHASAFKSLEQSGHQRDPDCVSCHVVGLQSINGFKSRTLTPSLTDVGCESCHGPGRRHVLSPKRVKMRVTSKKECLSCHTSDQSPNFNVLTYWRQIQHQ